MQNLRKKENTMSFHPAVKILTSDGINFKKELKKATDKEIAAITFFVSIIIFLFLSF